MYFIIETEEQLHNLVKADKCFIDLVALSEEAHAKLTSPSILYYNDFEKGYIIPINHSEGFSMSIESIQNLLKGSKVYLLDKKWHSYFLDLPDAVDVNHTILDIEGKKLELDCYTGVHRDFYHRFKELSDENTIIPISKHYERCECLFEAILPYIGKEGNLTWQNAYTTAYKWVEEQGIKIDEEVFDKHFQPNWKARSVKDGKVYTNYNLYNITSRPTNAFNGLNFLALHKEDGSRAAFVPENDIFIEFDFDGYHLRLIANHIGFELPTNISIHTYLGQQYFEKKELTPEEYQESKKITFRQLYNGVEHAYSHIEFFKQVAIFIDDLWETLQYSKYLKLPNGRSIKPDDFNSQKVFNYYIQCLETVNNVEKLNKLRILLEGKKSKIILVVYDSILIDFATEDGRDLLNGIREILEENNYLVKVQTGINYNFSRD